MQDCTSPAKEDVFNAFEDLKPEDVKVLIIGQDPYLDKDKKETAHGLAFSSKNPNILPASLEKIFTEIQNEFPEFSKADFKTYNLGYWKKQGILLLNSSLTYCEDISKENAIEAWKEFINLAIEKVLTAGKSPLVIMLWGNNAQSVFFNKKKIKIERRILILQSSHPNPRNKKDDTFQNCEHFKECNNFLKENGVEAIDWQTN